MRKTPNKLFKLSGYALNAPVRGLNLRDPLSATETGYALTLDNFIITPGAVEVRAGTSCVARTAAAALETLCPYEHGGQERLLAAGGGKIFACDPAGGALTVLGENFSMDRWQTVFYEGYLYFFNGADLPQRYLDGELAEAQFTQEDDAAAGAFDPRVLIGGCVYKNRLFLLEKGSLAFYYTRDAGAKSGPLHKFDLAQIASLGGELVQALAWTYATAGGAQESQLVLISSMGEVFIYAGDNPSEAGAWTLRGTYKIPAPLGRRAAVNAGGDIALACQSGLYMLSNLLSTPVAQRSVAFSDLINGDIAAQSQYFGAFGWELTLWAGQNMLLANVPQGAQTVQYVLNTQTGGWSRWTEVNALSFCVLGGGLFFVRNGEICRYGGASEEEIRWKMELAYDNFGSALIKAVKKLRVFLQAYQNMKFTLSVSVDFQRAAAVYQTSPGAADSQWDRAAWDEAKWGPEARALSQGIVPFISPGRYFSFGLQGQTAGQGVKFIGLNVFFKPGNSI